MKTTIPQNSVPSLLLIALALVFFALLPSAQALTPPPDGGYPLGNTAEGDGALGNAEVTNFFGGHNTAIGNHTLFSNIGENNTAVGFEALSSNLAGPNNTATGAFALRANTTINPMPGFRGSGRSNTADGESALTKNTTGSNNTAIGASALFFNTTANNNTATGLAALVSNTTGANNTANGVEALKKNTTGSNNIALGFGAGANLTMGNQNIDIGNPGVAGEADTIRIGSSNQIRTFITGISGVGVTGVAVNVNADGQLGTAPSSARFKQDIKPMDQASEAILALKPVTFCYKKELDPDGVPQFGLVAEEVEKVNPSLITKDADGKPYTVRYDAVNAMLLNEFLKEHRKVEKEEATIADLKSTVSEQQKQIKALASGLQKVSDQLELNKPVAQTVANNQ